MLQASTQIAKFIGGPAVEPGFYPSILGAVLFYIGIALLIEKFKPDQKMSGLGFYGAIAIILCGGLVLALWLIFAELHLPLRGLIFLWILILLLIIVSMFEFFIEKRK